MSDNKYAIKELSFDTMINELNNVSPLKISKKLIEYELYDQQDSIEIINMVYEEFESKDNIIDNLVNPMLLSLADGLIKHPKLNGTFRKTNITPSRLVKEVNAFTYEQNIQKDIDKDVFLTQAEKSHYGQFQRKSFYDKKSRTETRKEKELGKDEIIGKDMDHVNPINHLRQKYKNNPYLYRDDIAELVGMGENEEYIDSSLNRSKGDKTWDEYISHAPKNENGDVVDSKGNVLLTKENQEQKIELQKETTKAQNKEAVKDMAKNIGLKGLGDIIVLVLKPIWFEIKDMFKNGVLHGFQTNDKIEAFLLRLKRVGKFIKNNVINTLGDSLKDIIGNFIPMIISSIADIFIGIFKKIIQIIADGFMAIKEAFKIIMKPSNEISPAQKADAITKIIASAIVPILTFSFEETLSKIPLIGDVATIILSGLATTLVVWVLDQLDIFSVKDEKRMMRIKEIFELRVETIKKNTDIFESASLETLAKQKLQFKKLSENMSKAIDNNLNVNDSIYQMADFMQIDLKVKSTNDFLHLLNTSDKIVI